VTPRPIIIDTDPGQDDAVAILLALAAPSQLDVRAITSVAGNVPLALTTVNALKMVELAGRTDVPVYAGCDGPLQGTLITAEYVHGASGLDGAELPEPVTPLAEGHAVDAIVEIVMSSPAGAVTLCALGPLTNIAAALDREPRLAGMLREIVLMGGGFFEGGNTTPAAEFNIYVDPEAAAIVFRCGSPLTVMPLDVTHRALILPRHMERFAQMGNAAGAAVHGLLTFYERYDVEKYGIVGGPLHDPCVIAYLLEPGLFSGRLISVQIEVESPLTRGMTVADWWGLTTEPRNATWMRQIEAEAFFDLLVDRISSLP
jgi:purine nucleosidase